MPTHRKFEVIKEMSAGNGSIQLLCQIAGVSKSGYYKWIRRQKSSSEKQLEDESMKKKIMECYQKLRGIYGYRRIQIWLNKTYGLHMNHKRIQRLMNELGIRTVIRKKKPYYGKKEAYVTSDNHLNRDFAASQPNEKWATDITYLMFNGQKLYMSAIKDLFNNEIVAYQISRRNDLKLVVDTLKKAKKKRNVKGVLLHSDQGFQYTSRQYHNLIKKYQMKASMSRKGNCWDNACMENSLATLKLNVCTYIRSRQLKP
ncbi:IS3 family transposase [Bacillus swezeyi]|uniref:IS3 family transposase n=1 Tax=Bacillus swezeyi TaxID=1925020 RepID=UPI001FD44C7A|nr:IS3 family transposase [Bacillus swezeyi]